MESENESKTTTSIHLLGSYSVRCDRHAGLAGQIMIRSRRFDANPDKVLYIIRCVLSVRSAAIVQRRACIPGNEPNNAVVVVHQSSKLATSAAKPLLLLSRAQLWCFRHPGNTMSAAMAMAMTGAPVMTPSMASPVRCESAKNIPSRFGSSSRAIATQLSHTRVKALHPALAGSARAACTIAEGSKLPEADLSYFDEHGDVHTVKVSDLTKGKKVVLFAVPGAFTPVCSTQHLPGFVAKAEELRKAGVDVLACVSINDAFVMRAWGEQQNVGEHVLLLSDGLGKFTKAMGATVDLSDKPVGLGVRSRRYSMLVDDGVVKALNMEEGGAFTTSSADDILKCLQKHKAGNVECSAGQNVM